MTRRVPIVATLLVALAVAAMISLGVWQLQRKAQKESLLALYTTNETLPPTAFPRSGFGDGLIFRRASVVCAQVVGWSREGGRDAKGSSGWRQIAQCRGAQGEPPFAVQLGLTNDPMAQPSWKGGSVRGYITHAPDHRPLVAGLFGKVPKALMLVADPPAPGLVANAGPDLSSVPNNHLAYAVQWFVFAGVAAVIYGIALRRRLKG